MSRRLAPLFAALCACGPADDGLETATDTGATYVVVAGGTFEMGCTIGQSDCGDDETVHSVTLTHDYEVGATEVTQGQFQAVMGYNPSYFTDCAGAASANCPVEGVRWYEAAAYANSLSTAAGLGECYTCGGSDRDSECDVALNPYDCDGYRLLTEAEWEGAARCGTDLTYAGSDDSPTVAWTITNSGARGEVDLFGSGTQAAAGLAANSCGIYDMSGNVSEWTQDWYAEYGPDDANDPTGPFTGTERVHRGGNFGYFETSARVSARDTQYPFYPIIGFGLRVGRTVRCGSASQ